MDQIENSKVLIVCESSTLCSALRDVLAVMTDSEIRSVSNASGRKLNELMADLEAETGPRRCIVVVDSCDSSKKESFGRCFVRQACITPEIRHRFLIVSPYRDAGRTGPGADLFSLGTLRSYGFECVGVPISAKSLIDFVSGESNGKNE